MSSAACGKIIIDGYGAYAAAAAEAATVGEASCEALMQLFEDPKVSAKDREAILALSDKQCYWASEMREWSDEITKTVREMAKRYI